MVNVSTGLASARRTSACAARWITTSGRARATAARDLALGAHVAAHVARHPVGDAGDLVQRRLAERRPR